MTGIQIEIEIDTDVLEWFQAQGDDWQSRMNAVLKSYVEAHKRQGPKP